MQAIHASRPSNSLGSEGPRVRSLSPTRPPGRRTRANSRAASVLFGKVQKAHSQMIASNDLSGKGKLSASPRSNRTRDDNPFAEASSLASEIGRAHV